MPLLVLILLALTAGTAAGLGAWRYSARGVARVRPAIAAAEAVGRSARRHTMLELALASRLDPESETGLGLTLGALFVVGAGVVLGTLAYLVRTNATLASIDNSVAHWGYRHATPFSEHALTAITELGSITVVIGLCVLLVAVELVRLPNRWLVPFVVAVVGGEELIATLIKNLVDRARPALNPAAATLGPSFPSGHTTTAAAFWAAAALLLGRRRPRAARAVLAGAAVGIAVAVASSRVLLDFHWLSDVIGGLALGWAWFVLCGIAFGGRMLRFGVAAEVAESAVSSSNGGPRPSARDSQPRETTPASGFPRS